MFWFHSVLTSASAQAEAVLPTRCSARWDGTEAWAHPTYPGLIPIDAGSLFRSRREKERERRLKPSYCPAGLMREHRHLRSAAGNPGRAHGLPRNSPTPAEPGGCQPALSAAAPGRSRGAGHRRWGQPGLAVPRPPPGPGPAAAARPPHPAAALAWRSRPERGRRRRGRGRKGVGSGSAGAAALARLRRHEGRAGPGRGRPGEAGLPRLGSGRGCAGPARPEPLGPRKTPPFSARKVSYRAVRNNKINTSSLGSSIVQFRG